MEDTSYILKKLPYGNGFRFVDELISISETSVTGRFTFRENMSFYAHHFAGRPVTPGVLLVECMAQVGLACLGIYLARNETIKPSGFALSESAVEFLKPVLPGTQVTVHAEKIYFRFGKLKVKASLQNGKQEVVCHGTLSGMAISVPPPNNDVL